MSRLKSRLAACAWLDGRIRSTGATDGHSNAAIFDHHDCPDRIIAFNLLYITLKCCVFVPPDHVVSFEFLGDTVERRHVGAFVRVETTQPSEAR